MNNDLAPTYQRLFSFYWVLWYKKSNNYSVVDNNFKNLLYDYLECTSLGAFQYRIEAIDPNLDSGKIAKTIASYLEQCNVKGDVVDKSGHVFNASKRQIFKSYSFNSKAFQVNFDSDLVAKTIHPSIAHLETKEIIPPDVIYDIYIDNDQLCLFKNEALVRTVPKRDYHLIQGKFVMELLSFIHNKEESDWLGTFHGSTISDGEHSILFIGASGKGKSTLCAILTAKGFELLADDVSPMLASDSRLYHNPSALSIKEGSFNLLNPLMKDFDSFPNTLFNKTKGVIKYVPCKSPIKDNYPCRAILMVNYSKDSKTKLELLSIKEALETLIPESWLSPKPKHARQFLYWLAQLKIYELTYSDTASVVKEISALFKTLPNAQD